MNKDKFSLSTASFMLRYKARSYDQKLPVSKVPLKQDDGIKKQRSLSPVQRRWFEDFRDKDTSKHKVERMSKIIMRKLQFKYGRYGIP
jgi:hypothetical protein